MLPEKKQVLIVDDEPNLRRILQAQLTRDGYDVLTAEDGEQGLHLLGEHHIDLIVTDLKMPKIDGMTAPARGARASSPSCPIVMITAHGTVDTAVEALKLGAFDYLTKPFDKDEVRADRRQGAEDARARGRGALGHRPAASPTSGEPPPKEEGARFGIIGQSPRGSPSSMPFSSASRTAPTTVLITGESGTGKELVARALHDHSSRRGQAVHQGELRRDPEGAHRERAVRLRARRLHRRGHEQARANSSWPTAARCSSTRSARCRSRCR